MSEPTHFAPFGTASSFPFCADVKGVGEIFAGTHWTGSDTLDLVTCPGCIEALAAEVEHALTETPEELRARLSKQVSDYLLASLSKGGLPSKTELAKRLAEAMEKTLPGQISDVQIVDSVHDEVIINYKYKPPPQEFINITFTVEPEKPGGG